VPAWEYLGHAEVRTVSSGGRIRFRGRQWFLSGVLAGERVALEPLDDGLWALRFRAFDLARLDERSGELR